VLQKMSLYYYKKPTKTYCTTQNLFVNDASFVLQN